jgi:hypothetical protein
MRVGGEKEGRWWRRLGLDIQVARGDDAGALYVEVYQLGEVA